MQPTRQSEKTVAYTNHTIMQEALEKWPESMIMKLLPRIHILIKEIDRRFRNEVLANIIKFAAMAYKKPEEEINENTNVSEELGVQSMQRVALSASIENEYDVMIPVARIGNFKTIGDIVDYVMDEM